MTGTLKQLLLSISFEVYLTETKKTQHTDLCKNNISGSQSNFKHKLYQMKANDFYIYVMNGRIQINKLTHRKSCNLENPHRCCRSPAMFSRAEEVCVDRGRSEAPAHHELSQR